MGRPNCLRRGSNLYDPSTKEHGPGRPAVKRVFLGWLGQFRPAVADGGQTQNSRSGEGRKAGEGFEVMQEGPQEIKASKMRKGSKEKVRPTEDKAQAEIGRQVTPIGLAEY